MPRFARLAFTVVALLCSLAAARAEAQFGRNKVEYVDFDFEVLDTEHFSVYYYSSEEATARLTARLAERWYARLSQVLGHSIPTRQPLILYASQPEFAQTNVVSGFLNDGIGGVTEAVKRRIVMPFAPTLAETDQILGHEIAHAFQFDIARRQSGLQTWPLWSVEGMAQYLSLGASDREAAIWLRDAVEYGLLPTRPRDAANEFSPYRYGSAIWAYLAGRFGDRVIGEVLKAGPAGTVERRILAVTGVAFEQLYADWRAAAHERYRAQPRAEREYRPLPLLRGRRGGRLHLGPSLSPNGKEAVFFSERDRLSLDLYVADTGTGDIKRKLATTAAAARLESLQAVRSAGSWNSAGDRFAFAAVSEGRAALVVLDMARRERDRQITVPLVGQVFTPSWSPDGRSIAFSGLKAGATDLYVYDLDTRAMRQLTRDSFADLQPVWSPDGRQIAFVTDRFSTDLASLAFGPCELAVIDVSSGAVRRLPGIEGAKHVNPQWTRSPSGDSVYFVSDPGGISNVYRLEMPSGGVHQITDIPGGVAGLTPTSPALSVAQDEPVMAFTVYRRGTYELRVQRGDTALAGDDITGHPATDLPGLPPADRLDARLTALLDDSQFGLPEADHKKPRPYPSALFIESIGQPYLSSGGGPFGTFVRGGGSLLFSDVLGERKLGLSAQFGNHLRDLGLGVRFLNRERRWNWGAVAEVQPSIRRLPRQRVVDHEGQAAVSSETHYFERTQLRAAGLFAYPLNQAQRLEFEAGMRHVRYRQTVRSTVRSLESARVLDRATTTRPGGEPASVAEATAAFVTDTAVFGATGPILGTRQRFEIGSTFGNLSFVQVMLDHRRYLMPVKPYTIATRIVHVGQYGPAADDPRLLPAFLGSRQFVHGYGWSSLRCQPAALGDCVAFEELLGSRVLVGNFEVRAPLVGAFSRDIRYDRVPVDAFLFADAGLVWSGLSPFGSATHARRVVSSFGGGARVNAFGMPLEFAVVRSLNAPAHGWSFDLSLRPGF